MQLVKIAMAQMEIIPGRPDLNTQTMLALIGQARQQKADIIVFPEMAIPGYLVGDIWDQPAFLRDCEGYGQAIAAASEDICVIFGNIAIDWTKTNEDGRIRKYNACFIAQNSELLGLDKSPYPYCVKALLKGDDARYFFSLEKLALELGVAPVNLLQPVRLTVNGQELQIGCVIGEDALSANYFLHPKQLGRLDLFINIACSPFALGKNSERRRTCAEFARQVGSPLVYVNNVGIQNSGKTVYTYDGRSAAYLADGSLLAACPAFDASLEIVNLDSPQMPLDSELPAGDDIATVYQAVSYGTSKFLASIKQNKVVVGLSGGIDSAVAASLFTRILGPENVLLVNMPSKFNSPTTQRLAEELARNLGCPYAVIPIGPGVELTASQITQTVFTSHRQGLSIQLRLSPLAEENIQARDRGTRILAALAAAFGAVFSCNANKSEITVGYATMYGDATGFLAPLGDLWKHQIYQLGKYLNTLFPQPVIPSGVFKIHPSAELSAEQAIDQQKGDPLVYEYHDYLFRSFVESWDRTTPEEILQWYWEGCLEDKLGCEQGIVARIFPRVQDFIADLECWWELYCGMAVAKRIQAPPVIAVSSRPFGSEHRESQNGPYYTAAYRRLKAKILGSAG